MSDFGTCEFGAITPELVLRSLLSGIQGNASCGLRLTVVDVSQKEMTNLIVCTDIADLWTIFTQTLTIAHDGLVSIRAAIHTSLEGAGLDTCGACQSGYTMAEYAGSMFSKDTDGTVYLNLIQITT